MAMRWWQQSKNIYHIFQARLWSFYYGWPEKKLTIFGITGTNGKTTTSILLGNILRQSYGVEKVGLLSTITFWVGEKEEVNESKMTTVDSEVLFRYLQQMKKRGVKYVVLEITSHALDQGRLHGIRLSGAIILNVAREHLDYHKTMSAYAAAKEKIVKYLKPGAPLIGKGDDPAVSAILSRAQAQHVPTVTFTASEAQAVATPLPGSFNKENVLAASLLARTIGLSEDAIRKGVATVRQIPGRLEWLKGPSGKHVVIDYAVTPDALERLYQYVKESTNGKIFAVLGAAGLRDRGKRPLMAAAVAKYADELILTREDPWHEPEEQIFTDLEQGLQEATIPWQRIVDRREAIIYCVAKATPHDVVVVTGKGAEQGMGIGHHIRPWNERAIITEILKTT
ncbi:MAG: UDP-N-acetylmuramoyl-L-alanyl-D-glutamate--2,6-diaminopimelate ligase [Candidatus Andersenbacteria bacterium]